MLNSLPHARKVTIGQSGKAIQTRGKLMVWLADTKQLHTAHLLAAEELFYSVGVDEGLAVNRTVQRTARSNE